MITLLKLEAQNFRSLGDVTFEPLTDGGLTAVNGPNGSGKTSMLAAVLFALFGVTPDGVPIKAIRRQGSTDEVKVVLSFTFDGQTFTIERGLKGARDSHYAKVWVNGREQVFGKVTAVSAWLEDQMGLDKEGFLTAFAIRQKELDSLVKARPAERRALIERLAGIERMSTAVQTARAEESDARKRLELLPGTEDDLAAAQTAADTAAAVAAAAAAAAQTARDAAETAQHDWAQAQADADAIRARIDAHAALAATAQDAAHHAETLAATATRAKARLDVLNAAARDGSVDNLAAANTRYRAARDAADQNRDTLTHADTATTLATAAEAALADATGRHDRATTARDAADAAARAARDAAAAAHPDDLPEQVQAATQTVDDLARKVGALRGEHTRLTGSITALTDRTDPTCPTCATSLADPAALLATLRQALARVETDGKATAAAEQDARDALADLQQQLDTAQEASRAVEQAEKDLAAATTTVTETSDALTKADSAAASARAAATAAAARAEQARRDAATVETELDAATRHLSAIEAAVEASRDRDTAAQEYADAQQEAHTARAAAHAAATAAADAAVPETVKDAARDRYRDTQARANSTNSDAATATTEARLAAQRAATAQAALDTEKARAAARADTRADLEAKAAVKAALDAFRRDRIAALAPALSEAATELIPRMTDGKFVAVEFDEEFTPVITDDAGEERPVAWLSGGEESAVALALRLALGEIIAGGTGGLLWMDEPQTAMDATRRPAMMSVIRAIPGRQPIIISHVSEATDMVDLVYEVTPGPDGSTVAVAEPGEALSGDDLDAAVA